jgi:hypothetical protein
LYQILELWRHILSRQQILFFLIWRIAEKILVTLPDTCFFLSNSNHQTTMGFFRRNQPQPETPEKAPRLVVEAQDDVGPKSASSPRSPGECTTQTEIDLPVEVGLDEYEEVVHNDDDKKVVAEDQPKAHRLKVTSILLVVLLIVVVATALAITLSMQDNNNDIVTSVNARDTEEGQYLLNILNATADETTLLDSSTPQGQAFDQLWRLEYETHTHATPLRVIQRYGLLVLYHSTNPAGWENASGWSGAEECNYFGVDCSEVESGEMAVSTLNLGMYDNCECHAFETYL